MKQLIKNSLQSSALGGSALATYESDFKSWQVQAEAMIRMNAMAHDADLNDYDMNYDLADNIKASERFVAESSASSEKWEDEKSRSFHLPPEERY